MGCCGKADYNLKDSERQNLRFRRSVYFVKDVTEGSIVNKSDVKIIRPGFGLPPIDISRIIGRRLKANVTKGTATSWDQFY